MIEICLKVHTKLLDGEDTYPSYLDGTDWVHKMSQEVMNKVPYILLIKPLRSPDLNPIKNIFHLVGIFLRKGAIMKKIKRETYKQFGNRVLTHFIAFHQIL